MSERGQGDDEARQRAYYAQTAAGYDAAHVHADDAHNAALDHVLQVIAALGLTSALDVGAGTGRTVARLLEEGGLERVAGIEPVAELVAHGHAKGLPEDVLRVGDGRALPYPDRSFDVVVETGMLHHVKTPRVVVGEMLRVARRAVFLSDSNRFGQGRLAARLVKLGLYGARLWPLANLVKTRGKGYQYSEGDGVSYSYSVFDDLPALEAWADRVYTVPLGPRSATPPALAAWTGSLLTAPQVLVCALRDA
ncbi:MAG: class I SAM-dependent methyltransferase [Deltaproteobacteria bacterium HGW-Deltaproteobacteria-14]|jgi:ubiquinone/menaquinone biosynthesis C-methylase UbiE|nr:MAG: class I SAM-dependent methyltransferase [Deltaproteobacteria bacterium HGW-Deltaproteobacteria-14]